MTKRHCDLCDTVIGPQDMRVSLTATVACSGSTTMGIDREYCRGCARHKAQDILDRIIDAQPLPRVEVMTAPTDPIAEIRQLAVFLRGSCMHHENLPMGKRCGDVYMESCAYCRSANELDAYADLLAQPRARTCETCKFVGPAREFDSPDRECRNPKLHGNGSYHGLIYVPLAVNGQPFTCAGWTAREQEPRT